MAEVRLRKAAITKTLEDEAGAAFDEKDRDGNGQLDEDEFMINSVPESVRNKNEAFLDAGSHKLKSKEEERLWLEEEEAVRASVQAEVEARIKAQEALRQPAPTEPPVALIDTPAETRPPFVAVSAEEAYIQGYETYHNDATKSPKSLSPARESDDEADKKKKLLNKMERRKRVTDGKEMETSLQDVVAPAYKRLEETIMASTDPHYSSPVLQNNDGPAAAGFVAKGAASKDAAGKLYGIQAVVKKMADQKDRAEAAATKYAREIGVLRLQLAFLQVTVTLTRVMLLRHANTGQTELDPNPDPPAASC